MQIDQDTNTMLLGLLDSIPDAGQSTLVDWCKLLELGALQAEVTQRMDEPVVEPVLSCAP